ncbi:MAG TPA: RDD family protein [Candidatus Sulfotelmatobacter sp.]|nr:RDD family protein [Candidatus Sulfotelmatobacter sp.]
MEWNEAGDEDEGQASEGQRVDMVSGLNRDGEDSSLGERESGQVQPNLLPEEDGASWRQEVSERLHRYHARRRPRAPRYPSLRLKFEEPNWGTPRETPVSTQATQPAQAATRQAVARERVAAAAPADPAVETRIREAAVEVPRSRLQETVAKIIEFPRTIYAPQARPHELAEPVFDRPRILEAPEIVPPPPALGGVTIEEVAKAEPERRPGIDMPLQSASVRQRVMAGVIDASVVGVAAAVFGGIFYRLTGAVPTLFQSAVVGAGLFSALWVGYQYLLLVYSGTTAGLRALRLRVQRFDGGEAGRRLRRWRVLGSMVSAASLGMGYAWHFLDEDGLCWHERVTKTHIAYESRGET